MYPFLKSLLFKLNPEQSHHVALRCLQVINQCGLSSVFANKIANPKSLLGLTFKNPVGLAAGLDKNADYVDALAALGFGFVEIGTVTPQPQDGNPPPRLFRLREQEAIINRMGFNNKGIEYVMRKLERIQYRGILGINIGKNKATPFEKSLDDYVICFRELNRFASYMTINVSSPNTPGLRDLQNDEALIHLLSGLKHEQKTLWEKEQRYIPLLVKVAPDLSDDQIDNFAHVLLQQKIDGVIATNTTITRNGVENNKHAREPGGLSGKPLCFRSTHVISRLYTTLKNQIPIIASGGIMNKTSAEEKLQAGAELLQIYSGFIYSGPKLIQQLATL